VLAVSLGAHVMLLAAWLSTRPNVHFVEPPAMVVQLVRPPPCKSSRDHSDRPGDPCPSWSAEEQASHYNAANDSKAGGFAAEGERKLALKDYREKPGTPGPGGADASDYPGLRCTIFHKHC
jgi:hypothetical protein